MVAFVPLFVAIAAHSADFGFPSEVKAAHPEFFNPAHVSVVTNGETAFYVYSGRARRLFKNMPTMALPQLRDAAQLRAENTLSRFLLKGVANRTMTLRGSRLIAKEIDGDWTTYVFAVPVAGVGIAETPVKPRPRVIEPQTNKTAVITSEAKAKEDGETAFLALLDHVDSHPRDNLARAKLARAMFDRRLYDESVEQCMKVHDALIPMMCADAEKEAIESLLAVSDVLKECGEYRRARDGYRAVQKLERSEYRGRALQALSQLQLKLGVE